MAYKAYMSIKGSKQGQFKGEGKSGKSRIPIGAFQYSVESPRDVATGQASGKRQHKPITITKEWGLASPQLLQARATDEILSSVQFEFTRPGQGGTETVYHTITLTNALISAVNSYLGVPPHGGHHGKKHEVVTLEYEQQFITGSGAALPLPGEVQRFG